MTEPFIRCDHSTTHGYKTTPYFIKVLLNPDVKIYPNEYKGINFFVSRDILNKSTGWRATEIKSGSAVERYPYRHNTKKECIEEAHNTIDMMGDELNTTIDDLIEARAQAQHRTNLERGGVFGADGKRFSDIDVERRVSERRGTGYTSKEHAKHTLGFELSDGALCARYIKNFGYVEFGGD